MVINLVRVADNTYARVERVYLESFDEVDNELLQYGPMFTYRTAAVQQDYDIGRLALIRNYATRHGIGLGHDTDGHVDTFTCGHMDTCIVS